MIYLPRLYLIRILVDKLEKLCTLTHPIMCFEIFDKTLVGLEIKLTGTHCNLALLSIKLDDKYKVGLWRVK